MNEYSKFYYICYVNFHTILETNSTLTAENIVRGNNIFYIFKV